MKNNASVVYAFLLIIGDFLALSAAFAAAYFIRFKVIDPELASTMSGRNFIYAIFGTLPLWLLVHAFIGLYSPRVYERRFAELGRLLIGAFLGVLTVIGYDFFSNDNILPGRLLPVYGLGLGFGFLWLFRIVARLIRRTLFRFGIGVSNILIVGNTPVSEELAGLVGHTRYSGTRVLGIVGGQSEHFVSFANFVEAIEKLQEPIHAIIQTELFKNQDRNNEILRHAQVHHISYRFVPGNSDLFVGNIDVDLFAGLPVIAVHQTALTGWGRIVKRIFDLVIASALIISLSPLFILIPILIKTLSPKGPILFRQIRLTRFNREFKCYKFRTLKDKYNGLLPEEGFALMGKPELAVKFREAGDFLPNDPRLTKIGLFLRTTSLDELPQLFNVLKGDLSLVGPRALVPRELNAYAKKHTILAVKSGLTGLAQISGRKQISFEERRRLDMYYVQNWSFWLDINILLRTVGVVLFGAGAK